ncbi:hypothetical protein G9A89_009668 [Geosiphon pyriformis]|nr:hypothetical protein G9A89_009668 [Geosiphon pyriformis]
MTAAKVNEYELRRLQNLEENRLTLERIGLAGLQFKETVIEALPRTLKPKKQNPNKILGPTRRSLRERKAVNYAEPNENDFGVGHTTMLRRRRLPKVKNNSGLRTSNPGRRIQGGRIYDSVEGSSCHQCRQKTVEEKVRCTRILENGKQCTLMMDNRCLSARYGESVKEAKHSGCWECPKCRGICNCSNCLGKKGLAATGILYYTAVEHGYSNAKEYLAATKSARNDFDREESDESEVNELIYTDGDDSDNVHEQKENLNVQEYEENFKKIEIPKRKAPIKNPFKKTKSKASTCFDKRDTERPSDEETEAGESEYEGSSSEETEGDESEYEDASSGEI